MHRKDYTELKMTAAFTLPPVIVHRIDEEAGRLQLSKSAFVSMVLANHFRREDQKHAEADH